MGGASVSFENSTPLKCDLDGLAVGEAAAAR